MDTENRVCLVLNSILIGVNGTIMLFSFNVFNLFAMALSTSVVVWILIEESDGHYED